MVNKTLLLCILISIASINASSRRQRRADGICGDTRSVLCVNSTLVVISITAKSIERKANEIEKHILSKSIINETLKALIKSEMTAIDSALPTPEYHLKFIASNNIDKEYLGHLLTEAHDAMSFYYNSIGDVIKMNDMYSFETDNLFKQIEISLGSDIICRYRSVLAVYSLQWRSINQLKRIPVSLSKYEHSPSTVRNVHALIITKLLHDWMQRLHNVIDNLGAKFY